MNRIRSQARHQAWKVSEGGTTNWNPFAKTSSRRSADVEGLSARSSRVRSNGSAPMSPQSQTGIDGIARSDQVPNDGTLKESKRESDEEFAAPKPQRNKYSPLRIIDNIRAKTAHHKKIPVVQQFKNALFSWINILLVLVPVGFIVKYVPGVNPIVVFVINFIAIMPLAGLLSFATEELALYCGENIGGLLNATFGNAVELIVSIIALLQGKIVIVQTSLIGSMLSNLLLVLGMAFLAGGYNRVEQEFNSVVAQISCSLLAVAVSSLILPTAYHQFTGEGGGSGTTAAAEEKSTAGKLNSGVTYLSRATALLLLVVYATYLLFQLRTHKALFNERAPKSVKRKSSKDAINTDVRRSVVDVGAAGFPAATGGSINQDHISDTASQEEEEEEEEEPQLSVIGALVLLLASTVLVAFNSEFMVDGIDSVTGSGGISEVFVGLILIPIVGNAAEHATAVTVAFKDKIPLSISVAVGSSLQIALFVIPVMVCLGWWIDVDPPMTLWFDGFQTTALFITVLLVNYLISDGKTNYLEGLLLCVVYIIIAVAAYFSPESDDAAD